MGVRIIVYKPESWKEGNIFGKILSERNGNKLVVKMIKSIKGESIESDLLELQRKMKMKHLNHYSEIQQLW